MSTTPECMSVKEKLEYFERLNSLKTQAIDNEKATRTRFQNGSRNVLEHLEHLKLENDLEGKNDEINGLAVGEPQENANDVDKSKQEENIDSKLDLEAPKAIIDLYAETANRNSSLNNSEANQPHFDRAESLTRLFVEEAPGFNETKVKPVDNESLEMQNDRCLETARFKFYYPLSTTSDSGNGTLSRNISSRCSMDSRFENKGFNSVATQSIRSMGATERLSVDSDIPANQCESALRNLLNTFREACKTYDETDEMAITLMIMTQQNRGEALEILGNSFYDGHSKQSKIKQFQHEMDQIYYETTGAHLEEAYEDYALVRNGQRFSSRWQKSLRRNQKSNLQNSEGSSPNGHQGGVSRSSSQDSLETTSSTEEKTFQKFAKIRLDRFKKDVQTSNGTPTALLKIAADCKKDILLELNECDSCQKFEIYENILIDYKTILQDQKKIQYEDLIEIEKNGIEFTNELIQKKICPKNLKNLLWKSPNIDQITKSFDGDLKLIFSTAWIRTSPEYFQALNEKSKGLLESYKNALSKKKHNIKVIHDKLEDDYLKQWRKFLVEKFETNQIDEFVAIAEFHKAISHFATHKRGKEELVLERELNKILRENADCLLRK